MVAISDASEEYEAAAALLDGWDGSGEGASRIRAALRTLPPLRGKPASEAVRRVAQLVRLVGKSGAALVAQWPTLDPVTQSWAGVLLDDPSLLPWVFAPRGADAQAAPVSRRGPVDEGNSAGARGVPRPRRSDGEDLTWAPTLLALCWAPPTEPIVTFVREAFHARVRSTWIPASCALAALASRSPSLHEELAAANERLSAGAHPDPLVERWFGDDPLRRKHVRRHFIHLRCALAGRGVPLPGLDAEVLLAAPLPEDPFDQSAALHGFAELATRPLGEAPWIAAITALSRTLMHKGTPGYQHHMGLRALVRALTAYPRARQLVVDAMLSPGLLARHGGRLGPAADLGCSAALSLAFVVAHAPEAVPDVDAAVAALAPFDVAASLALGRGLPAVARVDADAVIERLRLCRSSVVALRDPLWLAARVAELVLLLEAPATRDLPWGALLEEAGLPDVWHLGGTPDATAGRVGRADLAVRLTSAGVGGLRWLLHDHQVTAATVHAVLAKGCERADAGDDGDKFLIDQAAIGLASLLEGLPQNAEVLVPDVVQSVRLLWALLRLDPPDSFWEEAESVLPWSGTRMHVLLGAMRALDAARVRGGPGGTEGAWVRLRARLHAVADALAMMGAVDLGEAIQTIPETRPTLPDVTAHPATWARVSDWAWDLERLLGVSPDKEPGLLGWAAALGGDTADARAAGRDIVSRLRVVVARGEADRLDAGELESMREELPRFFAALRSAGLAWPEMALFETMVGDLDGWATSVRDSVMVRRNADKDLERALASLDEAALCAVLGVGDPSTNDNRSADALRAASPRLLVEAHGFLLRQLRFDMAGLLKQRLKKERPEVNAPGMLARFSPLWSGVLGGGMFTLSLAKTWNDLAATGGISYVSVVVLALFGGLAFLAFDLRKRVQSPTGGTWGLVGRRILPVYGVAVVIAALESAGLLVAMGDTDAALLSGAGAGALQLGSDVWFAAVVMWTAMSVFGGIFLGLIAQGRGAAGEGG